MTVNKTVTIIPKIFLILSKDLFLSKKILHNKSITKELTILPKIKQ